MDNQEVVNNAFVRDDLPDEVEIIGVSFRGATKVYYFAANGNVAKDGDNAIVETARGLEYGKVTLTNSFVKRETLVLPLKNVVRIADKNDDMRYEANREKEKEAFDVCAKKIEEHKLDMKLIDVEYTFDNTKLLFYFTSDDRVDFRELVKDLASYFRTRIELRQIGIRDEAKIMGGLGICGRPFCCNTFLPDFVQVSIKMAKEQNLSLNSAKISGACGRLMCCLRYEYDTYQEETRRMPRVDTVLLTPDGVGTVTEVKPLQNTVKVVLQNDSDKNPKIYHLSVLKPYDPKAEESHATQEKATESTHPRNVEGEKREPKPKKEASNKTRPPRIPKNETVESEVTHPETPKTEPSVQEAGKNGHHHRSRRNRRGNQGKNGGKPTATQGESVTKPQGEKTASATKPSVPPKPAVPEKKEGQEGKKTYAPIPSNSIKKGQGGRFGGIKTRPSKFGKKDNS